VGRIQEAKDRIYYFSLLKNCGHPLAITLQLHQGRSISPIESFGNKVIIYYKANK